MWIIDSQRDSLEKLYFPTRCYGTECPPDNILLELNIDILNQPKTKLLSCDNG